MAVIKNGPYEITIRYACENGEVLGTVRGVHRAMMSFVVDENDVILGRLDSGTSDQPRSFPLEELQKHLGQQFATFNTQLEATQADLATAKSDLDAAKSEVSSLRSELEKLAVGEAKPD